MDDQLSTTANRYRTIAADDSAVRGLQDMAAELTPGAGYLRESKSASEITPYAVTTLSSCVSQPCAEVCEKPIPSDADGNHNSIFWAASRQCLGAVNCQHPVLPHAGGLCVACYQARKYSSVVQYPTAMTKL